MRKYLLLLILISITFSFSCCSKETAQKIEALKNIAENVKDMSEDNGKSKEEIEKRMKDYSIMLVASDAKGNKDTLIEEKNEKQYLINSEDGIVYFDFEAKKYYMLNKSDKKGTVMPISDNNADLTGLAGFTGISAYLFVFEMYRLIGAKKDGSGSVAGRSATIYTYELGNTKVKMWIDKDYGICTKYEITENGETKKMEIIKISFGNTKVNIDLSQYKLQDMSSMFNTMKKE
jgi:outer membrane lipoprotein-sorting protein